MASQRKHGHLVLAVARSVFTFLGVCAYAEWAAQRAVERSEQEALQYWKAQLLPPLYY
jgi:hypothetical protein